MSTSSRHFSLQRRLVLVKAIREPFSFVAAKSHQRAKASKEPIRFLWTDFLTQLQLVDCDALSNEDDETLGQLLFALEEVISRNDTTVTEVIADIRRCGRESYD